MDYETPQFFRVMKYASEADRDVVDMVSGSPDWEPPEALREGLHTYADGEPAEFQYQASVGLPELREEIASRRGVVPRRRPGRSRGPARRRPSWRRPHYEDPRGNPPAREPVCRRCHRRPPASRRPLPDTPSVLPVSSLPSVNQHDGQIHNIGVGRAGDHAVAQPAQQSAAIVAG